MYVCMYVCTLLTRWSASVVKVGVPFGLQSLYKSSVTVRILAHYTTLKSFMTKVHIGVLEQKNLFLFIAMFSIMVSLCSHDLLMTSLNTIAIL